MRPCLNFHPNPPIKYRNFKRMTFKSMQTNLNGSFLHPFGDLEWGEEIDSRTWRDSVVFFFPSPTVFPVAFWSDMCAASFRSSQVVFHTLHFTFRNVTEISSVCLQVPPPLYGRWIDTQLWKDQAFIPAEFTAGQAPNTELWDESGCPSTFKHLI